MRQIAITCDIDWAPDYMVRFVTDMLTAAKVKATFFITHESPVLAEMRSNPLFEIGAHPNFMPGSTHGKTEDEVLAHVRRLVPEAKAIRTHGLIQSSNLLDKFLAYGFERDVSLLLPHATGLARNVIYNSEKPLLRIPYNWEDDEEMLRPDARWTPEKILATNGLAVFDFHPVHVFLNSRSMDGYTKLKSVGLSKATEEFARSCVMQGDGPLTMLKALLEVLQTERSHWVSDL